MTSRRASRAVRIILLAAVVAIFALSLAAVSFGTVREVTVDETASVKFSYDPPAASTTPLANTRFAATRGEPTPASRWRSPTSSIGRRLAAKGGAGTLQKLGSRLSDETGEFNAFAKLGQKPPYKATQGDSKQAMDLAKQQVAKLETARASDPNAPTGGSRGRRAISLVVRLFDRLNGG